MICPNQSCTFPVIEKAYISPNHKKCNYWQVSKLQPTHELFGTSHLLE